MRRVRILITTAAFVLAVLFGALIVSEAQENETRLAYANGTGTLTVGGEKFKISSVVLKLLPDHKAELTLVSDITVFLSATWSNQADSGHEVNLEITRGSAGGLEGVGSVSLSADYKSLRRLSLKGVSRTTKRAVEAEFEGK